MKFAIRIAGLVSICVGALLSAAPAAAQVWPSRTVKIIISQPPGTAPDIITRLLADQLSRRLGQSVVVENRTGAQNIVGAQAAAKSPSDGYTFFVGTAAALVTNTLTFKTLPYDPAKDFVPVSYVGKGPFFLVANPRLGAKTLPDLVAMDKASPGGLKISNEGPKSFGGMTAAWLTKLAGTKWLSVPYNINSQGVQDTLGNTTELSMQAVAAVSAFVKRGDLKGIAVTSAKRLPGYDDIPAVSETFPGFEVTGWFIMVTPTGTPQDAISRMNREMDAVLKEPAIQARMADLGIFSEGSGSIASIEQFVRTERATWTKIISELGIQPE